MLNTFIIIILIVNLVGVLLLWTRDQAILYALFAVSTVLLFFITAYDDMTPGWKDYQREYIKLLSEREPNPKKRNEIQKLPIKIRQIWNQELGIADRCTSCHMGVDDSRMEGAPQPYSYHPAAHLLEDGSIAHDFNVIGCTLCHQGQGRATDAKLAHAKHIMHWEKPMYPTGAQSLVQASCPQCHEELAQPGRYDVLEGADMIMDARDFAAGENDFEIECISCHAIYGVGEVLAPDLGTFGATTEHDFEGQHNMAHVEGEKTKYNWTLQHFLNPQKITPDDPELGIEETIMPNFEMDEEMAHKLTTWVYSMKESSIPVKYRYRPEDKERRAKLGSLQSQMAGMYTAEEFEELSAGEKLFLRYNCWICHSIGGKGGKLAPDLSNVGKRRSKEWMIRHFKDPRSLSQRSFMPQFNLSEEQMDELVTFLMSLQ